MTGIASKKMCRVETAMILKACNMEELLNSNPYVVGQLYIDRLKASGFVEDEQKEQEHVSSSQERKIDDPTVEASVCDESCVVTDNVNIDAEEQKEDKIVSLVKEMEDDDPTEQTNISDETGLRKDKEATDKITIEVVTVEEQKGKEGLDALMEYAQAGIGVMGAYDNGKTIASGDEYDKFFTCDPIIIESIWKGKNERAKWQKIRRYYFKPKDAGLICLDIDIKNDKDGLKEFFQFCQLEGVSEESLPRIFQDFPNNFPCWVATPNGGYHLYFKDRMEREVKIAYLPNTPAVEVKSKQLTAGGSLKDEKPYILYGDISAAPPLPKFIENAIFNTQKQVEPTVHSLLQKQQRSKRTTKSWQQKKVWGKPPWNKITEWTEKYKSQEISVGKNVRAFHLARKAKTFEYTFDETLNELLNDVTVNSLPEWEIRNVVKSAYNYNR
jgi:hypothetical protein